MSLVATSDDPLRLSVCPRCAYSLVGLPPEGVCPECGTSYDQAAIVFHGSARGQTADLTNASPKAFVRLAVLFALQYWVFWSPRGGSVMGPSSWPFLAYVGVGLLLVVARRVSAPTPGLVVVRFTPEMVTQRDAPADGSATALLLGWWLRLLPVVVLLPWLASSNGFLSGTYRPLAIFALVAFGLAIAVPMFSAGYRHWQVSSLSRWLRGVGAKNERGALWCNVGNVVIELAFGGRFHLQVQSACRPPTQVVNADIDCTPEQAEALRNRIVEWRFKRGEVEGDASDAASSVNEMPANG